jgi:hypothetical protein
MDTPQLPVATPLPARPAGAPAAALAARHRMGRRQHRGAGCGATTRRLVVGRHRRLAGHRAGWIGRTQPLSAERVTGSLRAGGHIDQLVWQQDGLRVDVRDVTLAWQPWSLLHGTLKVNRLAAASVQVNDQRPPSTTPSVPPSALGLPLPVVLDGFSIGQFQWTGGARFPLRASRQLCLQRPGRTSWNCSARRWRTAVTAAAPLCLRWAPAARCQPGGRARRA